MLVNKTFLLILNTLHNLSIFIIIFFNIVFFKLNRFYICLKKIKNSINNIYSHAIFYIKFLKLFDLLFALFLMFFTKYKINISYSYILSYIYIKRREYNIILYICDYL